MLSELGELRLVDVVPPTDQGTEIRRRCITQPSDYQAILLHQLRLALPRNINPIEVVRTFRVRTLQGRDLRRRLGELG